VARALIVACGCRGRELGGALLARGWQVRGTSRSDARLAEIEAAGIEPALADPARIATIVECLEGVSVIYWLLGSAVGEADEVADLHGARLERLLEEMVDTPVRGLVYELTGAIDPAIVVGALAHLREAGKRWRIPFEVLDADPAQTGAWRSGMVAAGEAVLSG
jgi:NAD(P)-dependent dehydrogenase (short-subunit alcohol dehydrogenase family)